MPTEWVGSHNHRRHRLLNVQIYQLLFLDGRKAFGLGQLLLKRDRLLHPQSVLLEIDLGLTVTGCHGEPLERRTGERLHLQKCLFLADQALQLPVHFVGVGQGLIDRLLHGIGIWLVLELGIRSLDFVCFERGLVDQ